MIVDNDFKTPKLSSISEWKIKTNWILFSGTHVVELGSDFDGEDDDDYDVFMGARSLFWVPV